MRVAILLCSALMLLAVTSTALADSGEVYGGDVVSEVQFNVEANSGADFAPDDLPPPPAYEWVWDPVTETWVMREIRQ